MNLSNIGDYTTSNTVAYSNRNNVVDWNKHMAKWTNPFNLMPDLDPPSRKTKKKQKESNIETWHIDSLHRIYQHQSTIWSFGFHNNVIDLGWQLEQYESTGAFNSNKCAICLPGPETHSYETVCKWHHQLSVWHYLDIHFGIRGFLSTHEIICAGICATVERARALSIAIQCCSIVHSADSSRSKLFVNAPFQFDSTFPSLFVRRSQRSSYWRMPILCNKKCPLNKRNLQFKWLKYETWCEVVYGQWSRVETWNWWARQWSVAKNRQLRAVTMDTVHWQWSIWLSVVFKPAKMNLIAMWFELKMKDSFRLRRSTEHWTYDDSYEYIQHISCFHTGTIELDEKPKKKPKHSALIYFECLTYSVDNFPINNLQQIR